MEISDAVRPVKGGSEVDVMVSPNSNRNGFEGLDEWRKRIIIRVKSPPLDGKANREVEETFDEIFDAKCQIIHGQTSRQKTVFVPCPIDKTVTVLANHIK